MNFWAHNLYEHWEHSFTDRSRKRELMPEWLLFTAEEDTPFVPAQNTPKGRTLVRSSESYT